MNLEQMRRIVKETINEERQKTNKRNWDSIVENAVKSVLSEDASPEDIDLPTKLSDTVEKLGAAKATDMVHAGLEDGAEPTDDVVRAEAGDEAASDLKPSQSTMKVLKACQFAFSALMRVNPMFDGPGGKLDAIISSDNHIMDGHHRWIATLMTDPSARCQGPKLNLPGADLIGVLNLVTVGMLGRTSGNPGEGAFSDFKATVFQPIVKDILDNGYWGQPDAMACVAAAQDFVGQQITDNEELAKLVSEKFETNITSSGTNWKTVPAGAPKREDMPVINKDEVQMAVDALESGKVDLAAPYAEDVQTESFDLNRWNKLAGLLKD